MKHSIYPVIVVGSGISGLYAALKISQNPNLKEKVLLITKSDLNESNSYYAQGGMVAVLKDNKNDSVKKHVADTIKAGAGLNDTAAVKFISENSDEVVKDLLTFGVDFDKENGKFTLTKEAAHSVNRILHSGGDATGREMEKALCKAVREDKNIEVRENTMVVDLLVDDNVCGGVITFNKEKGYEQIFSNSVILATGGIGQLYKYTTNPVGATGDGIALGYSAGAQLQDLEFVQFHPTAIAFDDEVNHNRFLISEAMRGEGSKLCREDGVEFMDKYDERKELAPRDIVARSIFTEMKKTGKPNVYLNATVIGKEKLLKRFPTIAAKCSQYGIDFTKDYIPVAPAAHYFMGGIKTNLKLETSVKNLYAIGEVSSTGLHGANRLASNSILECVVCAYEVSKSLNLEEKISKGNYEKIISVYEKEDNSPNIDTSELKNGLKDVMWKNVGIYRTQDSLEKALKEIQNIQNKFGKINKCNSKEEYELRNMITTAALITVSALERKESRGAHCRPDFPQTEKEAKHSLVSKLIRKGENIVK